VTMVNGARPVNVVQIGEEQCGTEFMGKRSGKLHLRFWEKSSIGDVG
jgi:hypothetical protein